MVYTCSFHSKSFWTELHRIVPEVGEALVICRENSSLHSFRFAYCGRKHSNRKRVLMDVQSAIPCLLLPFFVKYKCGLFHIQSLWDNRNVIASATSGNRCGRGTAIYVSTLQEPLHPVILLIHKRYYGATRWDSRVEPKFNLKAYYGSSSLMFHEMGRVSNSAAILLNLFQRLIRKMQRTKKKG